MMTVVHASIDLDALADYLINEVDCSADYEDDQFGILFEGVRIYVERHPDHFTLEFSRMEVLQLPRC